VRETEEAIRIKKNSQGEFVMITAADSLQAIFDGWNGYNQSLIHAIAPLSAAQLSWRPEKKINSVGEVARHISLGRITWFMRMDAPGSTELARRIDAWERDPDGNLDIVEDKIPIADQADQLVQWLEFSWEMIEKTLHSWKISDLDQTYRHVWNGESYRNSRQWTIWRILNHDIHHGGEISLMLGMQGIEAFELSALFGHIVLPPRED
jgi:uncharacterized damage-inducible protein DinB